MIPRLESALAHVALCLTEYGEAYLPLFERLEAELESARAKESAVDRARRLVKKAA